MRPSPFRKSWLLLISALASSLVAQEPGGDEGAKFLLIPVGGRAVALGQTGVADGGSSESVFWNPAGLAYLRRSEIAIHHATTFASNNTVLSGYISASRFGVIGVSAYLVDFGSQEVVDPSGQTLGRVSPKNIELLASYATEVVERFHFGVSYKLIQFRQDCSGNCALSPTVVGTTHAVDFGAQYTFGVEENLRVGLAVQHLGFKLQLNNRDQADPLPTRVQLGAVYRFALPSPPEAEGLLDARVLLDLRSSLRSYGNPDLRIGIDIGYLDVVRLRAGYAFLKSDIKGPSIGIGFQVGGISIDFARVFFTSSNFDEPVHISIRTAL